MDDKAQFRRNPDYIYREIAGEAVLVPIGKAAESFFGIISINSTGSFLWKILEKQCSLRELSERLAREYELEKDQSLRDVTEFLETALSHNIVIES